MNILTFNKVILNPSKLTRDLKAEGSAGSIFNFINIKGEELSIHYTQNLVQAQIDAISAFMAVYSDVSVFDNLYNYLSKEIDPFVEDLLRRIRAENIEWGITQAGKTYDVLAFFEMPYVVPGKTRGISLKGALDTGSLIEVLTLLAYYIAQPNLYEGLAPFVTAERLQRWSNEIQAFLEA